MWLQQELNMKPTKEKSKCCKTKIKIVADGIVVDGKVIRHGDKSVLFYFCKECQKECEVNYEEKPNENFDGRESAMWE